jgi:hypothetical protein
VEEVNTLLSTWWLLQPVFLIIWLLDITGAFRERGR